MGDSRTFISQRSENILRGIHDANVRLAMCKHVARTHAMPSTHAPANVYSAVGWNTLKFKLLLGA